MSLQVSRSPFTAEIVLSRRAKPKFLPGYYTFQPALQELAVQKAHGQVPGTTPDVSATKRDIDTPTSTPKPVAPEAESSK